MSCKYKRYSCIICGAKKVSWKMPSFTTPTGENRIFFCWECAGRLKSKLTTFNFDLPPNRRDLLKIGQIVKVPNKYKQEKF